jgi:hypothetical protein
VLDCGCRPYLHDGLATSRRDGAVIATPLLELWPLVVRRGSRPANVEKLVRRQQPHNSAVEQAAGSRSLVTVAHCERSPHGGESQHPRPDSGVGLEEIRESGVVTERQ